jgi:HEPN domain-containing protein
MPGDPLLVAETRAWLAKAAADIAKARHDRAAEPPFLDDVAFHAQQAAERVLKAFLTWHGITFRKTHNLIELGQSCVALDRTLEPLLRSAAPLTEYAWKFRYPGEAAGPSSEEADEALATARQVYEGITARLPHEVLQDLPTRLP